MMMFLILMASLEYRHHNRTLKFTIHSSSTKIIVFWLAFLATTYGQFQVCRDKVMRIDSTKHVWIDSENIYLMYDGESYNVYDYLFTRSWIPVVKYRTATKTFFTTSLLFGDATAVVMQHTKEMYQQEKYISLLYNLCPLLGWPDERIFMLSRDEVKLQILRKSSADKYDLLTVISNLTADRMVGDVWLDYDMSNDDNFKEDRRESFHLSHSNTIKKNVIPPDTVKDLIQDVLTLIYYTNEMTTYLLAIKSEVTLVFNVDQTYFDQIIELLLKSKMEDDEQLDAPGLITVFPNNFWFDCPVSLCIFSDMDLILNLGISDEDAKIKIIKNRYFYSISTDGNLLKKLNLPSTEPLKNLFTSLIKNNDDLDKDILAEFVNLNNLDAGDHLILDENREMYFFVKESYVYSLFNTKNGDSLKQVISKQDTQSFFNSKIKNELSVRSVFKLFDKKLVVMMDDFLVLFSYANWDKENLAESNQPFAIQTLDQISASLTFRNLTYVFSRHYYQVFDEKKTDKPVQSIYEDFFECGGETILVKEDKPKLILFSVNSHSNHTTKRPPKTDVVQQNSSNKIIIQIVVIFGLLATVILVSGLLYIQKFSRKPVYEIKKEEDKKSISGSSANLSTIFNLAKSTSDKLTPEQGNSPTSKTGIESKLVLPEMKPSSKLSPSKMNVSKKDALHRSKYVNSPETQVPVDDPNIKKSFVQFRRSSAHSKMKSFIQEQSVKQIKVPSKQGSKVVMAGSKSPSKLAPTSSRTPSKMTSKKSRTGSKIKSSISVKSAKSVQSTKSATESKTKES